MLCQPGFKYPTPDRGRLAGLSPQLMLCCALGPGSPSVVKCLLGVSPSVADDFLDPHRGSTEPRPLQQEAR